MSKPIWRDDKPCWQSHLKVFLLNRRCWVLNTHTAELWQSDVLDPSPFELYAHYLSHQDEPRFRYTLEYRSNGILRIWFVKIYWIPLRRVPLYTLLWEQTKQM